MAGRAAHPVETLREEAIALEAEISACLADPAPKAVHHLRTTIRRIEAHIEMLGELRSLPPHRQESRKLHKYLKKLRRLAGQVRDLDVQNELIATQATSQTSADAERLSLRLKRQRDDEALDLCDLLRRLQEKVTFALDRLFDALRSVERLTLSAPQLTALTQQWFARHHNRSNTTEQLHAARKTAKLARYMAETAPGSAAAKRVAKDFENIQRAGGQWHDWLQLADVAAENLGKKQRLTESFRRQCDLSLRAYRGKLAKFL